MKKIYILIICLILVTGCTQTEEPNIDNNNEKDTIVETPSTTSEPTEPSETTKPEEIVVEVYFDGFEDLITPETASDDLGRFLLEANGKVTPAEADTILEWLLVYQLETIDTMNQQIYKQEYMEALNQDMGGVLNPDLIGAIENQEIAKVYKALVDGFLTVVRYEETPVVEPNWNALNQLEIEFSDNVKTMINLYDKIQNSLYGRGDIDFYALAQDAIFVENLVSGEKPSFLTTQLNQLYDRQVSTLFIGPEGSFTNTFIDKNNSLYTILIQIAKDYPRSQLSRLISELDQTQAYDFFDILDQVNGYNRFGIGSEYEMVLEEIDSDNRNLLKISMPQTPSQAAVINNSISDNFENLIIGLDGTTDYSINSYAELASYQYLSLSLFLSYTDVSGAYRYEEMYLNYDLKTGKLMSLEDLLKDSYDLFMTDLNALTGHDFTGELKFVLHRNGIYLFSETVNYVNLTIKDLVPYLPLDVFYR